MDDSASHQIQHLIPPVLATTHVVKLLVFASLADKVNEVSMPIWTLPHLTDSSVTLAGYFKSSQTKISQRTLNYPPQKGAV